MNILIPIAIILICIIAFYVFVFLPEKDIMHDETTNRFYKYGKESDNPHNAVCPKCQIEQAKDISGLSAVVNNDDHLLRPLIHSTRSDKKYHGVYCYFHGVVWFDKED